MDRRGLQRLGNIGVGYKGSVDTSRLMSESECATVSIIHILYRMLLLLDMDRDGPGD